MKRSIAVLGLASLIVLTYACATRPRGVDTNPAALPAGDSLMSFQHHSEQNAKEMLEEGRKTFRHDTFGSEEFWGGKLRLHQAIAGDRHGGVGPGLTARQALQTGVKVDVGALPKILAEAVKGRSIDLDKVETTLELLRANAVVGVTGFFDKRRSR